MPTYDNRVIDNNPYHLRPSAVTLRSSNGGTLSKIVRLERIESARPNFEVLSDGIMCATTSPRLVTAITSPSSTLWIRRDKSLLSWRIGPPVPE